MAAIAIVATVATSPGQTFLVAVFNTPIRESTGLSQSGLSTAYMLGTLLAALPMTLIGRFSDLYGPRIVMGVVAVGLGIGCILMGFVQGFLGVLGCVLLLRMLGQGALGLVAGHTAALWFDRRLGLVEGLRLTAMGGAVATLPAATLWLIEGVGWRMAYPLLGVAVWVAVLPLVVFLFRNHPRDVGQEIDGGPAKLGKDGKPRGRPSPSADRAFTLRQAVRTGAFWAIVAAYVANALVATGVVFHIQPLMLDAGHTKADAAAVMTTLAVVSVLCTLSGGWLADRLHERYLLGMTAVLLCASSATLLGADSLLTAHAAMGLLGATQAIVFVVVNPALVRNFGRPHIGAIRGLVTTSMVAGTSVGPVVMGSAFDFLGGYRPALLAFVALCVPVAILGFTMRRPSPPQPDRPAG